jgi:hypothetical protein
VQPGPLGHRQRGGEDLAEQVVGEGERFHVGSLHQHSRVDRFADELRVFDARLDGNQNPLWNDWAHDGCGGEHLGAGLRQPRQPSFGVADARGMGPANSRAIRSRLSSVTKNGLPLVRRQIRSMPTSRCSPPAA